MCKNNHLILCFLCLVICFDASASLGNNADVSKSDNQDGMRYCILSKKEGIASQLRSENSIYEICDVLDLKGKTVTIPNNCILKFVGGRLINGTIVGNNTIIESPDVQIFSFDRSVHCLKGSWKIDAWKAEWFGAINDGEALVNSSTFETTFKGTDNYNAIQSALDCAYFTNCRKVILREGAYRISRGLNMGWGKQVMMTLESNREYQDGGWVSYSPNGLVAAQILYDGSEYAINITGGYGTTIRGISVIGKSASLSRKNGEGIHLVEDVIERKSNSVNLDHYVSATVRKNTAAFSQYRPYAGIITDAYCGDYNSSTGYSLPLFPAGMKKFDSPVVYSVRVNMQFVSIHGFTVGYGISPGKNTGMNEYFKTNNCFFTSNVYAVAVCTRNGRNTVFRDCLFDSNYCGITNTKFGAVQGSSMPGVGYLYFDNCSFDHSFEIIEYNTEGGSCLFKNCYGEYISVIGKTLALGKKSGELKFEDCCFVIKSDVTKGTGIPSALFWGAAEFIRTTIKDCTPTSENCLPSYIIPLRFGGSLNQCSFYNSSRSSGLYSMVSPLVLLSGSKVSFVGEEVPYSSVYAAGGIEARPFYNRRSFSSLTGTLESDMFRPSLIRANLKNSYYTQSFDKKKGELDITYNGYSYPHKICVGDLIESYTSATGCFDKTLFVIVSVNSDKLNQVSIKAIPITGYRLDGNKYDIFEQSVDNQKSGNERGYWYVYNTRFMELIQPLVCINGEDNHITIKQLPLHTDVGDELYIKDDNTLAIEDPIILGLESDNKIGVKGKINYGVGTIHWLIKSYLGSRFWYDFDEKGEPLRCNKVQQLINDKYSANLTIDGRKGQAYLIIDKLGTCYGSFQYVGKSISLLLPKNTYLIVDCKTNDIVKTVTLNKNETVTI